MKTYLNLGTFRDYLIEQKLLIIVKLIIFACMGLLLARDTPVVPIAFFVIATADYVAYCGNPKKIIRTEIILNEVVIKKEGNETTLENLGKFALAYFYCCGIPSKKVLADNLYEMSRIAQLKDYELKQVYATLHRDIAEIHERSIIPSARAGFKPAGTSSEKTGDEKNN